MWTPVSTNQMTFPLEDHWIFHRLRLRLYHIQFFICRRIGRIPISRQTCTIALQEGPERVAAELRPPAFLVFHIRRCIGRKEQLHHRCFTFGCCLEQRSIASARCQHAREDSRLGEVHFLRSFIKAHFNTIIGYPRENIFGVVLVYITINIYKWYKVYSIATFTEW